MNPNSPDEERKVPVTRNTKRLQLLNEAIPAYEFLEYIDRGGMGLVYLARQKALDRIVAIKILPLEDLQRFTTAERFKLEARALGSMSHPHIVSVHDYGEAPGHCLYYVMDYVKGMNLRKLIKLRPLHAHRLPTIIFQICDALQYAHDQGIVHRDVKPANILLDQNLNVKVADFGLAKLLRPLGNQAMTSPSEALGTPEYIAPEALTVGGVVDQRADVFSLGVVLYELLTGELPQGKWAYPSHFGADPRFDSVVLRALQPIPAKRFQSIQDLSASLQFLHESTGPSSCATESVPPQPIAPAVPVDPSAPTVRLSATPAPAAAPPPAPAPVRPQRRLKVPLFSSAFLLLLIVGALLIYQPRWPTWLGGSGLPRNYSLASQQALAKWVFDHHGIVNIEFPPDYEQHMGGREDIHGPEGLPARKYLIWRVSFHENSDFNDTDLASFVQLAAQARYVNNLNLRGTQVSAAGISALPKMKNSLYSLKLQDTAALTESAVAFLAGCDQLERLFLSAPVPNERLARLKAVLPECEILVE